MNETTYFDFGKGVHARIRGVRTLESSLAQPASANDVAQAVEHRHIAIAALPDDRVLAVIVEWWLDLPKRERMLHYKVAVEFEFEDFDVMFLVDTKNKTISPKHPLDIQFFSIAYQTARGVVAAMTAGTPWSRRIPSLVSQDDLLHARSLTAERTAKPRRKSNKAPSNE